MSEHRLIYADELYETLANKLTWLMKYGNYVYLKVGRDIEEAISEQPTAYDVDKVVKQLEELKETIYESYGLGNGAYVAVCNAIEIVKRGGVE